MYLKTCLAYPWLLTSPMYKVSLLWIKGQDYWVGSSGARRGVGVSGT